MMIQSKIYNFLNEVETYEDISMISFTVADKENVLFDYKKEPYLKEGMQLVFSITKSFTSLAIGMLYDKGLIDLDETIIKYFKDELPETYDPKLESITIRHLLTMTTGIVKESNIEMLKTNDYRKYFLSLEVAYEPGTHYHYHSATSHMLSAIFTKITGENVDAYLDKVLFKPLEISNYHWTHAHEGISFGGYGLSINNDGLIKLGQILLNEGTYKGRRYISKAYLDMATSPQSIKQDYVGNPNAKAIGFQYGFQFHVSPNLSYRADGAYGQIVVIFNDLAFISTAQFVNYERLYGLIYKHFSSDEVKPISEEVLSNYIKTLTFKAKPTTNKLKIDKTYSLDSNRLNIKHVKFSDNYLLFDYENGSQDKIEYNFHQENYGESLYVKDLKFSKQPHWVIPTYENNTLKLKILYIETPFFAEYEFKFEDDKLTFTFTPSPNFLLNGFVVTCPQSQ